MPARMVDSLDEPRARVRIPKRVVRIIIDITAQTASVTTRDRDKLEESVAAEAGLLDHLARMGYSRRW